MLGSAIVDPPALVRYEKSQLVQNSEPNQAHPPRQGCRAVKGEGANEVNSDWRKILLRFPLCFLAYGENPVNRMRAVTLWCAFDVGRKSAPKLDAAEQRKALSEFAGMPRGFIRNNHMHVEIALGMRATDVSGGDFNTIVPLVASLNSYLAEMESKHGRQPYASIRQDLVWEVIKGHGMSYREMSVLAAIISWLGTRQKAFIARSVIKHRMLGYKSVGVMEREMAARQDGERELTKSELQTVLNRLHERGFFARVRKDPSHTYYSMRLPQDELEKSLLHAAGYKATFHEARKQRDKEFMARVRAAKSVANVDAANVDAEKIVHAASTPRPLDVHVASTLAASTVQNSNSLTEPQDIERRYRTLGTLCEASEEKALSEEKRQDGVSASDDDEVMPIAKSDGTLMTRREFQDMWKAEKAKAGLVN